YSVYDYALDLISAQGTPIPESSWAVIITNADIPELVQVGYNARVMEHQSQAAAQAWRKAASSGHADAAPRAARNLGVLLVEQGDVQGAKDAFQKAIDSGHADEAPKATIDLGRLLAEQGDVQGAKDAFQKAIDSGHPVAVPRAIRVLGVLLAEQ